jgi:filamentous hemagglutinin
MTIESLQDTATYDSDQKNMGFSADLDLAKGTGSSLSVNGGKTNLNSDYKAVGEQSGIFSNEADLTANGKGSFTGAVFTTSKEAQTNGKSNIVFKQGISSQDIKNTTSYKGEALSIGLSIGNTTGKPQATMNGIGYGTDSELC